MSGPARHPLAVMALHWLLAVLIIAMLATGFLFLPIRDSGGKGLIAAHLMAGIAILALTIARIAVRLAGRRKSQPSRAAGRVALASAFARTSTYLLVLGMAGTGLATAVGTGLNRAVFGPAGEPLPTGVALYPGFAAHRMLAVLLATVIAAHVALVILEQTMLKRRPFSRMSFRRPGPVNPSPSGQDGR